MKAKSAEIEIVGADANNLRDIGAAIPLGKLTAVVGVSGSGKSSLVEDTLAAQAAQRMQHFLDIPATEFAGLSRAYVGPTPPLLFSGQRAFRASSRTTLATATGMLRVLRRLFLSVAEPFADDVGEPVPAGSPATFAAWLKSHGAGRATVWATPVLHQATTGVAAAKKLSDAGIDEVTVRSETDRGQAVDKGRQVRTERFKPLRADVRHTLEAAIDRFAIEKVSPAKLLETLERAWQVGSGHVFVELHDMDDPALKLTYSSGLSSRQHVVHPRSPRVFSLANRHLLSFNSPEHPQSGACRQCLGLGVATGLDESVLIPHPERSMNDGAFALWTQKNYRYVNIQHETMAGLKGRAGFDPDIPWRKLSRAAKDLILDGASEPVEDRDPKSGKKVSAPHRFGGFRSAIVEKAGRPTPAGVALAAYLTQGPCHTCEGTRWAPQARALRVGYWSLDALLSLSVAELAVEAREGNLKREVPKQAKDQVVALGRIASALEKVGLGHLSGARGMLEVSGGESRRVRIGGVLSSRLAGLLLVLDEPARGLHEQDLDGLGDALLDAANLHTVLISEHRQRLVRRAHRIIEIGPGAGKGGGRLSYQGAPGGVKWVDGTRIVPNRVRLGSGTQWLTIDGVRVHNVADVSVSIPLGKLTCIAGVSGSGKSSFVRGALVPALAALLPKDRVDIEDFRIAEGTWGKLSGQKHVKALHALDQSAGTAQRRSLVATFVGIADALREEFAKQPQARRLGLAARDFGTNGGRGRCQRCLGLGTMDGGDCPSCGGLRFGAEALSVRAMGWSLSELLEAPVHDLAESKVPAAFSVGVLRSMVELGIGHLSLGRSLDTLSGGEVQRLRIARALARHEAGGALFVLDEPAGGLHPTDVERLEKALRHMLADGKNTVVLVEHDPHLLAACDHMVEFGPGGGPAGGQVVASGSPADVIKKGKSPTALALSGRAPSRSKGATRSATVEPATTKADAQLARAELRHVLGDDIEVPDDERLLSPAGIVGEGADLRPHELAHLDLQLGAFLLDTQGSPAEASLEHLGTVWRANPTCKLQIQPLLDELADWGPTVPRSVIEEANQHLAAMGLGPKISLGGRAVDARITGPRFTPTENSDGARLTALRDAWSLGNGYVELVTERGQVRAVAEDRPLDLRSGMVGPRHPTPAHLSRFDRRGACVACGGVGARTEPDRKLVVAKRAGKVLESNSLRPEAGAILKGIFRSEMMPFFRRLASEGLWKESTTWASLEEDKDALSVVMNGYWVRPGHGTFLKDKKSDGSEVNHWLRWDGLTASLQSQLPRSKHVAWKAAFEASLHSVPCRTCDGTGLGPTSTLIKLNERSVADWVKRGSLQDLLTALKNEKPVPPRAASTRQRLLDCLAPLAKANPKLRDIIDAKLARPVWQRAAMAFTGMPLADEA